MWQSPPQPFLRIASVISRDFSAPSKPGCSMLNGVLRVRDAAMALATGDVAYLVGVAPIQQQAVQQSAQQAAETPFDPR